jgi:hypothetical protein
LRASENPALSRSNSPNCSEGLLTTLTPDALAAALLALSVEDRFRLAAVLIGGQAEGMGD